MISDAIDTVITLGWALAVWIVLCAATATAALYALAVTVWTPIQAAREAVDGALAASRAVRALREQTEQHRDLPENLPLPAPIAGRRRPQPRWVLPPATEPLNASPTPESQKEHTA